jgi:hypothetical protein
VVVSLWVVGLGAGCTMMPAMSAAYQSLTSQAVPRATTMINIVQRVGGSIGTALFAMVLQYRISRGLFEAGGFETARSVFPEARAESVAPIAAAFAHTFWWPLALAAAAVLPALLLPRERPPETAPSDLAEDPAGAGGPTGVPVGSAAAADRTAPYRGRPDG